MKKNVIIIGAAGRDFHNFNTYFRGNKDYNVVAFTAEQIPGMTEPEARWQFEEQELGGGPQKEGLSGNES